MKIADNCCKDGFYYAEKAALGNAIRAARIKIGVLQNAARETKRGGTEKTRGELLRAERELVDLENSLNAPLRKESGAE